MRRFWSAVFVFCVIVGLHGCGIDDPGQPGIGSISVGAKKADGLNPPVGKKTSASKSSK